MKVYLGYEVPNRQSWQAARQQLEEWWKWPTEVAGTPGEERTNPAVSEALTDVSLALGTFEQLIQLGERRSQTLSVIDVFNLDPRGGDLEASMSKRLEGIVSQVGTNLKAVRATVERAMTATPPAKPASRSDAQGKGRATAPVSHAEWSAGARGLRRAATVIAQVSPGETELPSDVDQAVGLLGRLSLLAERRSRVLPVALLMGVGKEDAPRSVAHRIDGLLQTMRERLAARLLDGTAASR